MTQPNRDSVEDRLLEEEATNVVKGLSDAGGISFASTGDLRSSSEDRGYHDDDEETSTALSTFHGRSSREGLLFATTKSMSRLLASWQERALNILFPSSFEYTPIEMNDRSVEPTRTHLNTSGGKRNTGAKIETTKAESAAAKDEDEPGQLAASCIVSCEGDEPTEKELATLRKVADSLPWSAFIVALVELCERFTYYGLSGPFQNYIQFHPHDTPIRGAIGRAL